MAVLRFIIMEDITFWKKKVNKLQIGNKIFYIFWMIIKTKMKKNENG